MCRQAISKVREKFKGTLEHVLDKAGFEQVTQNDMEEATKQRSLLGLNVKTPEHFRVQCELYCRGQRMKEVSNPMLFPDFSQTDIANPDTQEN